MQITHSCSAIFAYYTKNTVICLVLEDSCEESDEGELYIVLLNYDLVGVTIRSTRTYNSSYVVYKTSVRYARYTTEKVLHWTCTSKLHCM